MIIYYFSSFLWIKQLKRLRVSHALAVGRQLGLQSCERTSYCPSWLLGASVSFCEDFCPELREYIHGVVPDFSWGEWSKKSRWKLVTHYPYQRISLVAQGQPWFNEGGGLHKSMNTRRCGALEPSWRLAAPLDTDSLRETLIPLTTIRLTGQLSNFTFTMFSFFS